MIVQRKKAERKPNKICERNHSCSVKGNRKNMNYLTSKYNDFLSDAKDGWHRHRT